jgi:hypothetical protein
MLFRRRCNAVAVELPTAMPMLTAFRRLSGATARAQPVREKETKAGKPSDRPNDYFPSATNARQLDESLQGFTAAAEATEWTAG